MADEKKVFDVTNPGKVKADPTAKPVIIGHKVPVSDGTVNPDKPTPEEKEVADPLTEKSDTPALEVNESKLSPSSEKVIEPSEELVEQVKQEKKEDTEKPTEDKSKNETEIVEKEKPNEPKPDRTQAEEKPVEAEQKPEDSTGKENAVNTVLGDAGNAKQAEVEALEKQERVNKLVEEGKYTLPIGPPRKHHGKIKFWQGLLILLTVFLLTIASFALAIDAEIIKTDYKLPFDLIKNSETEQNQVQTNPTTSPPAQNSSFVLPANWQWYENKELGFKIAHPKAWGEIINLKDELNLSDSLADNLYSYKFSKYNIKMSSYIKTGCPQGDGGQISTTQGWYEKNTQYYLNWCKDSTECKQDPECANREYKVGDGVNTVKKINQYSLLAHNFAVKSGELATTYSYAEGLFNLNKNQQYPGLSIVRYWDAKDKVNNQEVLQEFQTVVSSFAQI